MAINWHDYYQKMPDDWYFTFINEWNEACERGDLDRAGELEADALARGVWVDKSNNFRHPDDPHKDHHIMELLADDWIEY